MHKGLLIILVSLYSSIACAEVEKLFRGCFITGFEFKSGHLILQPMVENNPQTVYFIQNDSKKAVELISKTDEGPKYVSFKNIINAKNWAAFITDRSNFEFRCTDKKNNKINCQKSIKICQYTDTKFPNANCGNYWAIKSEHFRNTKRGVIKQGILLRW